MRITAAEHRADVDLAAVDLFDAGLYADGDPHAIWAVMRDTAPLHRQVLPDGRAFTSVTRYSDATRVLGNAREFTSERGSLLCQLGHGDASAGQMLVSSDPPRHTELRRPLQRALSPRGLDGARANIRAAVDQVLAPGRSGDPFDLAAAAHDFPMTFAGALMGFPSSDWPDLVRWTTMAAAPDDPAYRIGSGAATLAIAHHELFAYFARQAKARPNGSGDLLDLLATMDSTAAIIYNCFSLLLGANATTPHSVTGTVLALMAHPDQFAMARHDPTLVPSLVEEGLRWTSPANSFLRHALTDVELAAGPVRAGEAVAVWVGSANRDDTVFADPYRFDIRRAPNPHLAFGFGPHYCLGAHLARLALRELFTTLLTRVAAIEPAGPVRHTRSNFVAGISSLPIRMEAA